MHQPSYGGHENLHLADHRGIHKFKQSKKKEKKRKKKHFDRFDTTRHRLLHRIPIDRNVVGLQQKAKFVHGQVEEVFGTDQHQEEFHNSRHHQLHNSCVTNFLRLQVQ